MYDIVLHSGITSASGEERLGGTRPATTTTVESSGGGEGQNRGVGGDTSRDGSTDQSGGGTDPAVSGTTGSVSPGQPTTGGGGESSPMPPPSRSSRRRSKSFPHTLAHITIHTHLVVTLKKNALKKGHLYIAISVLY